MLGNQFFVPGKFYQVMTHRPDTRHINHWFEVGTIVKCIDITRSGNDHTVLCRTPEFQHDFLKGYFMDSNGVIQCLATGDVRRCRT